MLDPRDLLAEVHPDLVKVLQAAAQSPVEFEVTYGLRTVAAEQQAVATGHSMTMHSRHLADTNYGGKCCAVDVTPIQNGEITFTPSPSVVAVYSQLAEQIKAAAAQVDVPIEWGGDWVSFKDWGHFQLPWKEYP